LYEASVFFNGGRVPLYTYDSVRLVGEGGSVYEIEKEFSR